MCSLSIITQWYILSYCAVISHLTSLKKKRVLALDISPMIQCYRQKGHTAWWKWNSGAKSSLMTQHDKLTSILCAFPYLQSCHSYCRLNYLDYFKISYRCNIQKWNLSLNPNPTSWVPLYRWCVLFLFISYRLYIFLSWLCLVDDLFQRSSSCIVLSLDCHCIQFSLWAPFYPWASGRNQKNHDVLVEESLLSGLEENWRKETERLRGQNMIPVKCELMRSKGRANEGWWCWCRAG